MGLSQFQHQIKRNEAYAVNLQMEIARDSVFDGSIRELDCVLIAFIIFLLSAATQHIVM